jgi:hypothetical protein
MLDVCAAATSSLSPVRSRLHRCAELRSLLFRSRHAPSRHCRAPRTPAVHPPHQPSSYPVRTMTSVFADLMGSDNKESGAMEQFNKECTLSYTSVSIPTMNTQERWADAGVQDQMVAAANPIAVDSTVTSSSHAFRALLTSTPRVLPAATVWIWYLLRHRCHSHCHCQCHHHPHAAAARGRSIHCSCWSSAHPAPHTLARFTSPYTSTPSSASSHSRRQGCDLTLILESHVACVTFRSRPLWCRISSRVILSDLLCRTHSVRSAHFVRRCSSWDHGNKSVATHMLTSTVECRLRFDRRTSYAAGYRHPRLASRPPRICETASPRVRERCDSWPHRCDIDALCVLCRSNQCSRRSASLLRWCIFYRSSSHSSWRSSLEWSAWCYSQLSSRHSHSFGTASVIYHMLVQHSPAAVGALLACNQLDLWSPLRSRKPPVASRFAFCTLHSHIIAESHCIAHPSSWPARAPDRPDQHSHSKRTRVRASCLRLAIEVSEEVRRRIDFNYICACMI